MTAVRGIRSLLVALAALVALTSAALAQTASPDSTAPRDSVSAAPDRTRASWLSDRVRLRAGDLLTVVVDEQTAARERVSRLATGNRNQRADLRANINGDENAANLQFGMNQDSRDVGEAGREGDLTAVLTVRVTAIGPDGLAQIAGSKQVDVDGRLQEVSLKGVIRPQDVSTHNTILSSRIAEAVITYKGKKIGPRTGIIGKILAIIWP